MVTVILLIRGSILEVIGYRNASRPPPQPLCDVVERARRVFFSDKMTFLEISDMHLLVFCHVKSIFGHYLMNSPGNYCGNGNR